jgi:RNA-directed DNA polymerase
VNAAVYHVRSSLHPLVSWRRLEAILGWGRDDLRRIANNCSSYYRPFEQRKRGGGGVRHIDIPNKLLKQLLKRINRQILQTVDLPASLMGATKGKSIRDNGALHVAQPIVVVGDIEQFFPSVRPERVFHILVEVFGCSGDIAATLTRLMTNKYRLPQGSPTSSMLASLALLPLHDSLRAMAKRKGCVASAWCDDIAVSGGLDAISVMRWLANEASHHGYRLSKSKTRIMAHWKAAQRITGTTVNSRVSRGRRELSRVRRKVLEFGKATPAARSRIASIKGDIYHTMHLNQKQGESLLRLLRKRLPGVM